MVRIKVDTIPPLPPLQAWHLLQDTPTIAALKHALCSSISSAHPQHVELLLDGFLLLDPTPCDILRDGDLVRIRQVTSPPRPAVLPPAKRPRPDTDSSEEDSVSSSSSSSSSSDSDSDSSDDSSDSSSSSGPSELPFKLQESQKPGKSSSHYVPPGQGKLATQRRNLRRRTKKRYDKLGTHTQAVESANPNDIPVEPRRPKPQQNVPPSQTTPEVPPIMMASLSNKNKRRGFKQAMSSARPAKIIFGADNTPDNMALTFSSETQELPFQGPSNIVNIAYTRLVPPSEKQAAGKLPPNVFVTSIDVENPDRFGTQYDEYVDSGGGTQEEAFVLPYDDPVKPPPAVDFLEIKKKWDVLSVITDIAQVKVGSVVAWKALGLNPATWSPEICLYAGRVLKNGPQNVIVFKTQDTTNAADGDVSAEEEEIPLSDILQLGWRIVV
ncbi:hypothetical protein BXZ70DRAFT_433756 [Cristinia sonorae]|uniref:Coilin n=1 Tax=Cristinia sonorae TaxID=1940300 RepID=A0A8K0UWI3_9AGAR|nr:hypothetical protein BXZ70DRAFT_433756 [Cristinia sonorae]